MVVFRCRVPKNQPWPGEAAEALTICAARVAADGGDARKALQERGAGLGSAM